MTKITIDAENGSRLLEFLKQTIDTRRKTLEYLKEHYNTYFSESCQESIAEYQALAETLESALGFKDAPRPGERIRVIQDQGIYVRAGREGLIIKRVPPEEIRQDQYQPNSEIWEINYQAHPEVDDQEMTCHTQRSQFVVLCTQCKRGSFQSVEGCQVCNFCSYARG